MVLNKSNKIKDHIDHIRPWNNKLGKPFNDQYLTKLNKFINLGEKKNAFHHKTINIFKAFQFVKPEDIKIVIFADTTNISTGLPYGSFLTSTGDTMNDHIEYIENAVQRDLRKGLNLNFDHSLESWAMQGVLILNTSYTFAPGFENKYLKIWKKFNMEIIKSLNIHNVGLHFVFLGGRSMFFSSLVNQAKHWVYRENKPEISKSSFNVKFMEKINERITSSNGYEYKIQWHKYI